MFLENIINQQELINYKAKLNLVEEKLNEIVKNTHINQQAKEKEIKNWKNGNNITIGIVDNNGRFFVKKSIN